MALSTYNGHSGEKRERVQQWLNIQWDAGRLERPCRCLACTQTEGALHGHLEDYDQPETFVPLCITCHLVLHMRFRNPAAWLDYCDVVAAGWTAPPLLQRTAFGALQKGILRRIFNGGVWRDDVPPDGTARTYLDTLPATRQAIPAPA